MLCCLLLGAVFGPLGLWIAAPGREPDCCRPALRWLSLTAAVVLLAVAGWAAWLMLQPGAYRHICSLFAGS